MRKFRYFLSDQGNRRTEEFGGEGVGSEKGEPITLSSLVCELDELAGPTAVAAKFPAQLQCIIGRRCINQNLLLFFHNHSSSTLFNAI